MSIVIHQLDVTNPHTLRILLEGDFHLLAADPPYSPWVHEKAISTGTQGLPQDRDLGFEPLSPELRAAVAALTGKAKRWSLVFSDVQGAHLWWDAIPKGVRLVRPMPWIRWSQPQISGDRPPSGVEMVSLFHGPRKPHWSGPGNLTAFMSGDLSPAAYFDQKSLRGEDKYSCEKPLDLMLAIVSWFSDWGETVLDPVMGAGTTLRACQILGRHGVGLDKSAEAVAITRARMSSSLTEGERERVRRWVESQRAWLAGPQTNSTEGRNRWQRASYDTDLAEGVL
jgi:hypothetical protein